ncbi:hypothetical protein ACIRON_17995 [Nocardioides sp. NPDC101246]|uniref:hypothetical protein n=1 Tax=Nocardioides sp. NPDC101246 TaxID=3364336 RepID=UPI0038025769
MSADHDEDVEAARLNLAQIAAAPDVWRARAISAGGFLGAAAAVTLWSLAQQGSRVVGAVPWIVAGAALCYLLAVIFFLIASILPTPEFDGADIVGAANQLHASATQESGRIKAMVFIGAGVGCMAIVLTSVSIFLILMIPVTERAYVTFSDAAKRDAAELLCPDLPSTFLAEVTDEGLGMVRITVVGKTCPDGRTELVVPRTSIVRAVSG